SSSPCGSAPGAYIQAMLCATSRWAPAASAAATRFPGSLAAHAGVAARPLDHPGGIEAGREIGQLMDHDIRPSCGYGTGQRGGVEDIDHHRLDAGGAQRVCFGRRAGRPDDLVPGVEQQRHQPLADGAPGSGQENLHDGLSLLEAPQEWAGVIGQFRPVSSSATDRPTDASASATAPNPRPITQTSVQPASTHAIPANAEPRAPPA